MALKKTLPRARWSKSLFWYEHRKFKERLLSSLLNLPTLSAGEFFLTDEDGNYLVDEDGNYLVGSDA